jgi:Glutathione peroxidase
MRTGAIERAGAVTTIYDFSARLRTGTERPLADYCGKVLLVVNVASECGFTPQYIGLESLHEQFTPRGFEILGFPCDQLRAATVSAQSTLKRPGRADRRPLAQGEMHRLGPELKARMRPPTEAACQFELK